MWHFEQNFEFTKKIRMQNLASKFFDKFIGKIFLREKEAHVRGDIDSRQMLKCWLLGSKFN